MERGRIYGKRHGTSVSQLVGDFLSSLPDDDEKPEFTPTVSLLYGIAVGPADRNAERPGTDDPVESYHKHLAEKFGSR
jgi:hypothetical protein